MTDYQKTHPLWNRSPEWIATRASMAMGQADKVPHGADTIIIQASLMAALVHMVRAEVVRAGQAEDRVEELTKAIQAAHDDMRDDLANYPTASYHRLLDIVPEPTPPEATP